MLRLDEKALNVVHSRTNLRKVAEAVQGRNATKVRQIGKPKEWQIQFKNQWQNNAFQVERLCAQGLDPNHHDVHGESLLTLAAGIEGNRAVIVQLVGGGAHLDFRNAEGQVNGRERKPMPKRPIGYEQCQKQFQVGCQKRMPKPI